MKKTSLLFLIITSHMMYSNITPEGFERFPNYYFVETGTFGGEGVQLALRAGFEEIHTIEIDNSFAQQAQIRFRDKPNVHIYTGDSAKILWDVIKTLDKPITFWLDGHNGFPDPNSNEKNCPLMEELEQIKLHPIKTHTIVIDDMHCCGTLLFDFLTKEDIKNKVLEINLNYVITFVDGGDAGEYPDNIMVAYIP